MTAVEEAFTEAEFPDYLRMDQADTFFGIMQDKFIKFFPPIAPPPENFFPGIIQAKPLGWWFNYNKEQWCGPFPTPEKAIEAAGYLVPMVYPTYELMCTAPWETRTIQTRRGTTHTKMKCPHCKGGFVGGSCCRACEGTGEIEKGKSNA